MSHEKTKRRLNLIILIAIFFAVALLTASFQTPAAKFESAIRNPQTRFYPVKVRGLKISAELARTPSERQKGLSGRERLGELNGMLFVFENDAQPAFWMKNMRFPIDIIWIDRNLLVVGVASGLTPDSFPQTFSPPQPIRYALEINAGLAADFSIRAGNVVAP